MSTNAKANTKVKAKARYGWFDGPYLSPQNPTIQ